MLNNLNSNTNIPKKTSEQRVDKCLLSLQDQINETNNRITDLQTEVVSECGRIDGIESDNISTRILESESTRTNSLQSNTGTIDELKSTSIETECIEVSGHIGSQQLHANAGFFDHLSVINDLYLNCVKACDTSTSRLSVTQCAEMKDVSVTSLATENVQVDKDSISIGDTLIQNGNISTENVRAVSSQISNLSAEDINTTNTKTTNINAESGHIVSLYTNALKNPFELNTDIQGSGKINIQPNIDLPSQWVSIRIPHEWLAKRWMFAGYWKDSTTTYNWSVSGFGSTDTGVIAYTQSALETIRDFRFDKESGDLYLQVRAEDYILYQIEYLKDTENKDIEPIDWVISREGIGTLYTPDHLRGYVFQSYNDDTVEFYFGGDVCLYSLKAEVQDFDWATYKNIGIVECIRTPKEFDNSGNVIEWTSGTIGDYLTYREVDVGGNIGTITVPIWETPTIILSDECKEKLVKAEAFECWNGTYVKEGENLYPLTELGDNTTVHGSEVVENKLQVCTTLTTPHIYDGEPLECYCEFEDDSLVSTEEFELTDYFYTLVNPPLDDFTVVCRECGLSFEDTALYNFQTAIPEGELVCCTSLGVLYDPEQISAGFVGIGYKDNELYLLPGRHYGGFAYKSCGTVRYCVERDRYFAEYGSGEVIETKCLDCYAYAYRSVLTPIYMNLERRTFKTEFGNRLYRKTTKDDADKLDQIAVYESEATLVDSKPIVYCANQRSLKTTECLSIECGEFDNINVRCNAVIGGDLYVKGVTYTTDEETVSTTDTNIVLRQNNPASLANGELSGIIINNYKGDGSVALVGADNQGTLKVGTSATHCTIIEDICYKNGVWYNCDGCTVTIEGDLVSWDNKEIEDEYTKYTNAVFVTFDSDNAVAIAARDEESLLQDSSLICWDESDWKMKTICLPTKKEQVLESEGYGPAVYTRTTECGKTFGWYLDQMRELHSLDCCRNDGDNAWVFTPKDGWDIKFCNNVGFAHLPKGEYNVTCIELFDVTSIYYCCMFTHFDNGCGFARNYNDKVTWTGDNYLRYILTNNCHNVWSYNWVDKKAGNYTFNTVAEYETFATSNNVPDGSVITILCEDSRVYSEEI